jgi:thioredoxin reductase
MYDAIVIGGGPAGLQAGLTLGRMHHPTLVLDSGSYRNSTARHLQNFLTHDGTAPSELRAAARLDLKAYADVEVRDLAVGSVRAVDQGFAVETSEGSEVCRRLILATGVTDDLPEVPGIAELWGTVVAHCPFCHGHEFAGGTIVVQGGPHAAKVALMMAPIAANVIVVDEGHEPNDAEVRALAGAAVEWRKGSVVSLVPTASGAVVNVDAGPGIAVDGFFARSTFRQSAPFAEALGLELLPSGCVAIDALGRTSLPGVYAAGDLAHLRDLPMPLASVLTAAAAGLTAAAACHHDLLAERVTDVG